MSTTTDLWWTVRNVRPHRWAPEAGWASREQAERDAKAWRRDTHRRCVVVFGSPTADNFADRLMDAVMA